MLVVLHHVMDYSSAPVRLAFIDRGGLAVDFFFILSGYILMHVYGAQASGDGSFLRRFFVARFAKLYPVHLFILLLFLALVGLSHIAKININQERFTAFSFFAHVFLLTAWGVTDLMSWNFPAWSISAEWAAYLAFPALVLMQAKWPAKKALLLLALGWLVFGSWLHLPIRTIDFGVARILPEFLGGMLLYRILPPGNPPPYASAQFLAAFLAIMAGFYFDAPDVLFAPAFAWLIGVAPGLRGMIGLFLSQPAFVRLGEESYSLYMVHILVFTVVYGAAKIKLLAGLAGAAPHVVDAIAVFGAIYAARAMHSFVEVPAQTWIRSRFQTPSRALRAPVRPA
jgi:peptidoglycan/LPS O-acetylase OafA/YrhL